MPSDLHGCLGAPTPAATPSCWAGSSTTPPDLASSSRSKAPAATASDSPAPPPPPACPCLSANNPTAKPDAARQNLGQIRPDRRPTRRAVRAPPRHHQLPIPRADGDREALRIPLGARHDLTVTSTAQINRLRALLRDARDDTDTDRQLARAALTDATLTRLARRRLPRDASELRTAGPTSNSSPTNLNDNMRCFQVMLSTICDEVSTGLLIIALKWNSGYDPVTSALGALVPGTVATYHRPQVVRSPGLTSCNRSRRACLH